MNKAKSFLFIVISILAAITSLMAIKKILVSRDKWIEVEILSMAGSWWWQSPAPPLWLSHFLQIGGMELGVSGKPIAEIKEIVNWSDKYLIRAKIKVSENPLSKGVRFKDNPIAIGQPIVIEADNVLCQGSVIWIEGKEKLKKKTARIQATLYHRYPWEVEAVKNNPPLIFVGREIFKIENVSFYSSPLEWEEKGKITRRTDLVDIVVEAIAEVEEIGSEKVFLKEQNVKVGKDLYVPLAVHDLDYAKVKKIDWLD
jgi:hypothetical protein